MESPSHVTGMLDRDIRTVKSVKYVKRLSVLNDTSVLKCEDVTVTKNLNFKCLSNSKESCTRIYRVTSDTRDFLYFKRLLFFGACLSLAQSVSSFPTNIQMDSRLNQPPRWLNPCGGITIDSGTSPDDLQLQEFIHQITQASAKLSKTLRQVKSAYAKSEWHMDVATVMSMLSDKTYPWLPDLHKKLGEEVSTTDLEATLNEKLSFAYTTLQTLAVGLEQMLWDQEDSNGQFLGQFNDTYHRLIGVLCELQLTMVATPEPVGRDIMDSKWRTVDKSEMIVRDIIILRECENAMEFIEQVFNVEKRA